MSTDVLVWYYNAKLNFGDLLTTYILNYLGNDRHLRFIHSGTKERAQLIGIGSLLQGIDDTYVGRIWTTGALYGCNKKVPQKAYVYGLRGQNTLETYGGLNAVTSQLPMLGDGGLLLGLMHQKSPKPRYSLGIVPHYVDERVLRTLVQSNHPRILIISTQQHPKDFMHQLVNCRTVISSSLHGIIASDALGIPNRQFIVRSSKNIVGGQWKFRDYYSSLGETLPVPFKIRHEADILQILGASVRTSVSARAIRNEMIRKKQVSLLQMTLDMFSDINNTPKENSLNSQNV